MDQAVIKPFFEIMLRRLYQAEQLMYEGLDIEAEKASSSRLKELLCKHKEETATQMERLKKAFSIMGWDIDKSRIGEAEGLIEKGKELVKGLASFSFGGDSKAMAGVIEEGAEVLKHFENTQIKDFVIVCGAQAVEMGEIAAYRTLIRIAEECGFRDVVSLLKESLSEEEKAYEMLGQLALQELRSQKKAA